MDNQKKSFLVYLDAFPHLQTLSMEQRGELFTGLFQYAEEANRLGPPESVGDFADTFVNLSPEGVMAFRFMAATIARDFHKWLDKKGNYQAAARRRKEQKQPSMPFQGRGVDVYPSRKELEDMMDYI